jgi:penicillin-binding protein 2
METSSSTRRIKAERALLLSGVSLFGFAVVTVGLARLQIVQHEELKRLSNENRVRVEVLRAPRGTIYDRNGVLLADSAPSFNIVFRPFPTESTARVQEVRNPLWVSRVGSLLQTDTAEVRRAVELATKSGKSAVLIRNAPFELWAGVEELREELPGIEVQPEPLRRYLHGTMAAHLLGYAGQINDQELEKRPDYQRGDLIGRTGVERSFEDSLRGEDGAEFVVVDAAGRRVSRYGKEPQRRPKAGHDLTLTLDIRVQRALEDVMSDVPRGAAVAIDPRDGGILGMVSRPAYDPNEFSVGLTRDRWRELSSGGAHPLMNRAIQGRYPPGSTYKIVTMLSALSAGLAEPETRLQPCPGHYMFGGRSFGCWKREGHGSLDFIGALQHSCDVYFYQIGPRLGLERLEATSRAFGLGKTTGIDLPQEAGGLVPSQKFYDRRLGKGVRLKGTMLNLAIGQGELLVTPIQLALLLAETSTHGKQIHPHVVRAVEGRPYAPATAEAPVIQARPESWNAVNQALELVVEAGTATSSRVPGVRVAGKTGTAQNPHGEDHALYACYAPADNPQIALAFVIENGGHGGSAAAPRAGRVLRGIFLPDSLNPDLRQRKLGPRIVESVAAADGD